jgi:myo-inositol-hexaphosphate 3-phosphohydrolase
VDPYEFEPSMVYVASFRLPKDIRIDPISKGTLINIITCSVLCCFEMGISLAQAGFQLLILPPSSTLEY